MKIVRFILPVLAILALLASSSFFVVKEGHQAIVTQFGKPVSGPHKDAGLYFKLPFVQEVHMFEERLLKWDGSPNQITTKDKKFIWVDTTARWKITEPLTFLQNVATETGALDRLDDVIDSVVRSTISSHLLVELVRSKTLDNGDDKSFDVSIGREQITREMLQTVQALVPQYGIQVLDIRIKRINYEENVQKQVYARMISERKRIASQYRSEGEGEKQTILGEMKKKLATIRSGAYKTSQEIKGAADAEATQIYGKAFGRDAEFYKLFKTLETYKELPADKMQFIFSTDGEYFKYMK